MLGLLSTALAFHLTYQRLDTVPPVIIHPDPLAGRVVVHVLHARGAGADPFALPGLAHLAEHLAYAGSANVGPGQYDLQLAAVGGDSNAWTDYDRVSFWNTVPPESLELALFLEIDRLFLRSPPSRDALERELRILAVERDSYSDPDLNLLRRLLWPPAHPYHHPLMAVPPASVVDVMSYVRQNWPPSQASIVVAGAVDPAAVAQVAAGWPSAHAQAVPRPLALIEPWTTPQRYSSFSRYPRAYVAWRTVGEGDPDALALELIADLLQQLLPGAQAAAMAGAYGGSLRVGLDGTHALRALERAVNTIKNEPDPAMIARAVQRHRLRLLQAVQPLEQRAEVLNLCFQIHGDPDCVGALLDQAAALTPADIARVASRYLGEGRVELVFAPRPPRGYAEVP